MALRWEFKATRLVEFQNDDTYLCIIEIDSESWIVRMILCHSATTASSLLGQTIKGEKYYNKMQ